MTRLIVIGLALVVVYCLIRYTTTEKQQKYVVISLLMAFLAYIVYVVTTELFR